jgi:lysophospholipase L1-like esterase
MKTVRSILSLLLALAMLASLGTCFAAAKDYSGYEYYVSLGDSIANGIGENNVENKYMHRTPGAYPDRIAKATGAYLSQLGCGGMRTVELRACLEDDYVMPDEYANNFTRAKVAEIRHFYRPAVAAADLITLNIGANDVATYALLRAKAALAQAGVGSAAIASAENGTADQTDALSRLLALAKQLGGYVSAVNAAISGLTEGYSRFVQNFDAIIGDIYALNPDVTLLVAGFYNPFNELKISDDSLLELGRAADGIIAALNRQLQYG